MNEKTRFIPHSRPTLGDDEARAAAAAVASGQVAEGPAVAAFEQALAGRLGVAQAVAASSGTAALHLVLAAMGVGPGDEVVIPSFVCTALLNAVNYTGAAAVIADIDPATLNLDPRDVQRRLTRRTRAVIVPHMFGLPADLEGFLGLGVPIIEDCAHSVGAVHGSRPAGAWGQAAVFSFYATKVLAAGEGGMVATSDPSLAARVRDLKAYDRRDDYRVRFNYKLTEMQAAVGRVQLGRLDDFIRRRRGIAARLRAAFERTSVGLPPDIPGHIYFRFVVDLGAESGALIGKARAAGVGCERPVHTPLHRLLGTGGCPRTERAWRQCFSVPIYPSLSDAELDRIVAILPRLLSDEPGIRP
jgi:dTDP-4-amino-4,6-dideoxygalactose transaminase